MMYLLFAAAALMGGYFAYRYYSVKHALREVDRELREICRDISQNQIVHLPLPDREMEEMIHSVNDILEMIRLERQGYERREKEFQRQIENISHDLRTPLTVILGYLGFIKQTAGGSKMPSAIADEQTEILEIIESKARYMEKLVTQFYTFSRLNASDFELAQQVVDVGRILRETLAGNYQMMEKANLAVDVQLPEHAVNVIGDMTAFERIFSNLLQNSGRYADSYLNIYMSETQNEVTISFSNDTDFMPEESVEHLFERFYMQDDSRHQGGTGLGLTIAKYLTETMDGTLNVELTCPASESERTAICFLLKFKLWTSSKEYGKLTVTK